MDSTLAVWATLLGYSALDAFTAKAPGLVARLFGWARTKRTESRAVQLLRLATLELLREYPDVEQVESLLVQLKGTRSSTRPEYLRLEDLLRRVKAEARARGARKVAKKSAGRKRGPETPPPGKRRARRHRAKVRRSHR